MRTWLVAFATAMSIALCLTMCACGSPGHPPPARPAGRAGAAQDSARRSQLEAVVQCLRAHGVPDFPDPVYDSSSGQWHYGDYRADIPQRAGAGLPAPGPVGGQPVAASSAGAVPGTSPAGSVHPPARRAHVARPRPAGGVPVAALAAGASRTL